MTLRLIRNFINGTDAATAANLSRQLSQFEDNVADETDDIRNSYQTVYDVVKTSSLPSESPQLAPGQAMGFDTETGSCNVLLAKPSSKYAGQSVIIYKRKALNFVVVAAKDSTITGAATFSFGNAGRYEIFCDGVEYWA